MPTVAPPIVRAYAPSGAALSTFSGQYASGPLTFVASCSNCGDERVASFCANCGQERGARRTSFGQMAHEFIEEHFGFDSKFLRTLAPLLARPGWLTREYLIGRRIRYVRPLKLYLLLGVVYFLALTLHGGRLGRIAAERAAERAAVHAAAAAATTSGAAAASAAATNIAGRAGGGHMLTRRLSNSAVSHRVYGELLPKTMLVLVPVLALMLHSAYRNRGWFFADHLVFSLHIHAFTCVLGLAMLFMPSRWQLALGALGWGSYQLVALHTVYRATWWSTVWKSAAVMLVYSVIAFFATILTVVVGVYE